MKKHDVYRPFYYIIEYLRDLVKNTLMIKIWVNI